MDKITSLLPRQDISGVDPSTADTTPTSQTTSSGMSLPLLLAIAIGGGVLLFICLAFLLVAFAGRRHRRAARSNPGSPNPNNAVGCPDTESTSPSLRTPSPRPRRLTKSRLGQQQTYMDMIEIRQQQPHRSLASIMGVPRSKTFGVFGSSSNEVLEEKQQRGGGHRQNNSWIDEDAIHGPRVQRDGRRLSVRDSFILRTPTLPDLLGYDKERGVFSDGQFMSEQQYPTHPRPVSLPAQRGPGGPPRVPLPRTASYELAEKLAAAARGGVPPVPAGPRLAPVPPRGVLRHKSTESDLAEILRSTEERLQNGTPSNSRPTTRQRGTSASAGSSVRTPRGSPTKPSGVSPAKAAVSPTKQGSPVRMRSYSPVKERSPVKSVVINHVGQALDVAAQQQYEQQQQQRTRTPSPHKRLVVPVLVQTPTHHKRSASQASAASDADSLFGETTPEVEHVLPTGLSSPSRRDNDATPPGNGKPGDRCMSMGSLGSNASSSLSTLYSVNEPEDDGKTGGTGREGHHRGRKPKGLLIDTSIPDDPFVTAPPEVPLRSPRRQASSLPPLDRISPAEDASSVSRSANNSPVPRPLDVVKRTGTGSPTRLSLAHTPGNHLAASPESIRPRSVSSQKPVFLAGSTSITSMQASPGTSPEDNNRNSNLPSHRSTFGQKVNVFPPPLNLRPASPTLVTGSNSPSPPIRASPSTSPSRPLPSPQLLSSSPRSGSPTIGRYKRRGMASPIRERVMSRQPASPRDNRADRVLSSTDCPAIVLKPSDDDYGFSSSPPKKQHRDFAILGLQSTVAQLRRMNSQMSTLSAASSASDPDSPTVPNMRGGGFSPERSSSRVSRMGRQNYLSLGLSPRAKRNTIRGARNSIAVIKGRPVTASGVGRLGAPVEEKENEGDVAVGVLRGPRPLNPTPRRGVRGAGAAESPTKGDGATATLEVFGKEAALQRPLSDSGAVGVNRGGTNLRI
ncbi:alpha-galactosidase [Colletotrichum plurivorum]|uniref:Alpha-galactosidase n=1 Tax=Colletotrichum plurivorum TaxID=2175906 RepID=A0A8H6KTQ9_9PEZI|nr:alpha-galactosidase [Colletotrichum plurivorum]